MTSKKFITLKGIARDSKLLSQSYVEMTDGNSTPTAEEFLSDKVFLKLQGTSITLPSPASIIASKNSIRPIRVGDVFYKLILVAFDEGMDDPVSIKAPAPCKCGGEVDGSGTIDTIGGKGIHIAIRFTDVDEGTEAYTVYVSGGFGKYHDLF